MQHKIHMQDQVTNRIDMIMQDQQHWLLHVIEDLATLCFVVSIVAVGIIW
jgi:hypothetical protein